MKDILAELQRYSMEDRMHQAAAYLRYREAQCGEAVPFSPEFVQEIARLLDGAARRLEVEPT